MSRLTDNIDFHGQAPLLPPERQKVISGNIAHAHPPGSADPPFDFRPALARSTPLHSTPPTILGAATPATAAHSHHATYARLLAR